MPSEGNKILAFNFSFFFLGVGGEFVQVFELDSVVKRCFGEEAGREEVPNLGYG